jgi:exonuclease VII small subunit
MRIHRCLFTVCLAGFLVACSGHIASDTARECARELDAAESELSAAQTEGLGEAVTIVKAASLVTAAAFQRQIERYERCTDLARRARVHIEHARKR